MRPSTGSTVGPRRRSLDLADRGEKRGEEENEAEGREEEGRGGKGEKGGMGRASRMFLGVFGIDGAGAGPGAGRRAVPCRASRISGS